MSLTIMQGATEMLKINFGFTINANYTRLIQKTALPYSNQVFMYDMITTEKTYTLTASLNTTTTDYATLLEIKQKLDALFPATGVEYSIVDSNGIWNISKCIIEDLGLGENPPNPDSFEGVSFKIIEYTTSFTAV